MTIAHEIAMAPRWRSPEHNDVRDDLASDIDDRVVVPASQPPTSTRTPRRDDWRNPAPKPSEAGWEIGAAIAGWPVIWALGLTNFAFPLLGIYLGWKLHRRGRVRVPPGFWIWMLFLALVVISAPAIGAHADNTLTNGGAGRYLFAAVRFLNYLGVTMVMLFIGNLTEKELPRIRVVRWIAALGVSTVALGLLAMALPDFGFRTALGYVLPQSLLGGSAQARLAQVQAILGASAPRPAAPFTYTNAWGNTLSLLLVGVVLFAVVATARRRRAAAWAVFAISIVPIVYSLNRGVWTGIGLSIVILGVRLAARGRIALVGTLLGLIALAGVVFVATPLGTIVTARLNAGHSNSIRESLAGASIDAARQSPVVGFGTTRLTIGSDVSIAIGNTPDCPKCGNREIGSTGQLWLLLISQGFLGALLYFGFFLRVLWEYRRDASLLGLAASLIVLLEAYYSLFYTALTMPLAVTMAAIGLLWRNDDLRRARGAAGKRDHAYAI